MKLSQAGAISTTIVIVLGILMVAPIFARTALKSEPLQVVLLFSVQDMANSTTWCSEVGSFLRSRNIAATVFFTGNVVDSSNSSIISEFGGVVDVGSMTYDYVNLNSILDYSEQLQQIAEGKMAVDAEGNVTSRVFMAPYGSVNSDIYSLLNRSNITADFSYSDHYNKFVGGQFIRMDLQVYDYDRHNPEYYLSITDKREPVAIRISDSVPPGQVEAFISQLASGNVRFISASELTGLELTTRR
ncbi:MAG: polysaccharide deacetylase family protein [Candidatus Bathyarchaeia archaeon]